MTFCLRREIHDLKLGEELKVKTDWMTHHIDKKSELSYSSVVSTDSGQVFTPWLKMEDLRLLGFDIVNFQESSNIPVNEEKDVRCGPVSIQYIVNILWEEIRLDEDGEIEAAKGFAVTTDGKKLEMSVDGYEFKNLGFRLDRYMPILTRYFDPTTQPSSQVSCQHSKPIFCRILGKEIRSFGEDDFSTAEEMVTFPSNFLQLAIPVVSEEDVDSYDVAVHTIKKPKGTKSNKNQNVDTDIKKIQIKIKKNGKSKRESFSHPMVRMGTNSREKKYICLKCNQGADFPSKIMIHLATHIIRKGNFCQDCKTYFNSESHHLQTHHGIILKRKDAKKQNCVSTIE